MNDLEAELTGYIRNAAERQAKSRLELIQAEVSALSARLNRDNSYAAVQESLGYVYDSMGVDALDGSLIKTDLKDVTHHLASNLGSWTQAEVAPFNWSCYAPEREDQAYSQSNFRTPEAAVAPLAAETPAVDEPADAAEPMAVEPSVVPVVESPEPQVAAAQDAALAGPLVESGDAGGSMRKLEVIAFGTADGITPEAAATLDGVAEYLRSHPDLRVEAIGFSDNQGSLVDAHQASVARAGAVVKYLMSHGVDTERLVSKGYGASSPVATNASPEGRAANRRVELYLSR